MIQFELVSPEEKLISEPVRLAVMPGTEGEFGVGEGHTSLVAALKPGIVSLFREGDEKAERIFIAGGFADVTGELCTVLAEEAVNVNALDKTALEQDVRDLQEDLKLAEEEADKMRIQAKLSMAEAKLKAAGK